MGAIFGTALSLMLTVGGAAVAADRGVGAAQHHLAGHVLLGVGIGLLIATALRTGLRLLLARPASPARTAPVAPPEAEYAPVTVLPVRTARTAPLRGRHAA
ncbi:hypothetical protein [Arthrobacter sp. Soil764]|uniref:hypothetical protein n=1 Tax=Arthrobacter sp. Soil764 TaxID=1736403 RepID=UPI0006FD7E6E|nr:hypothetical protein [Arthrobacter sp. Soil764]KRE85127.1 hypothetical protein ASG86_04885 [Arthrobacter sp. Soil764]